MATVEPTAIQAKRTTAEDTLQRKSRDASVVSGGHLVAKALKNEGVDTIFTLCGGHIIDIYDGCVDEGIRIIDVRHEQVAAHDADGYARQTGKLGCVVTTAGPGFTNAITEERHHLRLQAGKSIQNFAYFLLQILFLLARDAGLQLDVKLALL